MQATLATAPVAATPAWSGSRVVAAFSALMSFECVFVLFIFSGQYKADPRFDFLPLDATVLFALLNVIQLVLLAFNSRVQLNPRGAPVIGCGVLFVCYVILSTLWCEGQYYANYKAAYVATINLWCLIAGALVISSSARRLRRFFSITVLFSSWIASECLLFYVTQSRFGRVLQINAMANDGAYIGLGRAVMSGALICGLLWLFGRNLPWGLWKSRAMTVVSLTFLLISGAMVGARGPIVAAALSLMVVSVLYSGASMKQAVIKNTGRVFSAVIACSVMLFLYKLKTGSLPLIAQRFLAFSSSSEHYDASGQSLMRLELFYEGFRGWLEKPIFGHGIGGFPLVWGTADERLFPHNLVLELLCELGVIGTLLFALIPFTAIRLARSDWRRTPAFYKAAVVGVFGFALLNTMTSGDLPDNRFLFVAIGLLALRAPVDDPKPKPTLKHAPPRPLSPIRQPRALTT